MFEFFNRKPKPRPQAGTVNICGEDVPEFFVYPFGKIRTDTQISYERPIPPRDETAMLRFEEAVLRLLEQAVQGTETPETCLSYIRWTCRESERFRKAAGIMRHKISEDCKNLSNHYSKSEILADLERCLIIVDFGKN